MAEVELPNPEELEEMRAKTFTGELPSDEIFRFLWYFSAKFDMFARMFAPAF
jgi:hypothetical protein